jgi:hypothetical protein
MAGAVPIAPVGSGLGYLGDWSKEARVTIYEVVPGQIHVCMKESSTRKVIVGVFAEMRFARMFKKTLERRRMKT